MGRLWDRDWLPDYQGFLDSPRWQEVRAVVLERDGGRCVRCGAAECLQVHHRNYRRLDDPDTCVTLCRSCHEAVHDISRINISPKKQDSCNNGGGASPKVRPRPRPDLWCPRCSGRYACCPEHERG